MPLPKFIVGVIGLVQYQDKYLLLRRSITKDINPGTWECVAGKVEYGENPHDTLIREVKEEAGLSLVGQGTLIDSLQCKRGDEPMILLFYHCQSSNDQVSLSHEHDCCAWMTK